MNKETIYIEPSDDITDILSKLKSSDKKIVALVPPKKPSVLLSSVNIKLIARTAKAEKKAVVLVTTDDSLTKLAMTANLPVAPSLKSRPVMPDEADKPAENFRHVRRLKQRFYFVVSHRKFLSVKNLSKSDGETICGVSMSASKKSLSPVNKISTS